MKGTLGFLFLLAVQIWMCLFKMSVWRWTIPTQMLREEILQNNSIHHLRCEVHGMFLVLDWFGRSVRKLLTCQISAKLKKKWRKKRQREFCKVPKGRGGGQGKVWFSTLTWGQECPNERSPDDPKLPHLFWKLYCVIESLIGSPLHFPLHTVNKHEPCPLYSSSSPLFLDQRRFWREMALCMSSGSIRSAFAVTCGASTLQILIN